MKSPSARITRFAGKKTDWFPADALELEIAKPIYENVPGWHEPSTASRASKICPQTPRRI